MMSKLTQQTKAAKDARKKAKAAKAAKAKQADGTVNQVHILELVPPPPALLAETAMPPPEDASISESAANLMSVLFQPTKHLLMTATSHALYY